VALRESRTILGMSFSLGSMHGTGSQDADPGAAAQGPAARMTAQRWASQLVLVFGSVLLALWLLAMFTHDMGDAAFSTSGDGLAVRNKAGVLGAWLSDMSYVLLGRSAWWALLFGVQLWLIVLAGLLRGAKADVPAVPVRPPWLTWLGLLLLLVASASLEWTRLYRDETGLAGAHAGGMIGASLGPWLLKACGFVGSGLVLIAVMLAALGWAFGFSWLGCAERIGAVVDALRDSHHAHRERVRDERLGAQAQRERAAVVEEDRHVASELPPLVIEPAIVDIPLAIAPAPRVVEARHQHTAFAAPRDTRLPQVELLDAASGRQETITTESLEMTSRLIEKKLKDFGVEVHVVAAQPGPVITRYEIEPATGVKGSQIVGLAKDLARSLSLVSIRVVETIPGKNCMALELPNLKRQTIRLAEILGSQVYHGAASQLTMGLGKDIVGAPMVADLARMPHLLVAGTTGSGKSVGINAMILSLLYKAEASDVRLILIDPKMLEMSVYEGIPHLLAPVVTDMKQAANALNWCVAEMDRRYRVLSRLGVRNLASANKKIADAAERGELIPNPFSLTPEAPEPLSHLPHIVLVIDELADLMMVVGKKIEELIARLAQKARASGIHLILATQRPSVDVITGLIKANIPTRIAFQVSSKIDSRTILDQMGAEALLGQGDMLYLAPGTGQPVRVHGAFVSDDEVHRVVSYLKSQGEPNYIEGILEGGALDADGDPADGSGANANVDPESDSMYDQAVAVVLQHRRASISLVQRHLRIGYNRAARLLDQMEKAGLVSNMATNGNRDILVPARKED
jgi:S-DNA-T family DNA segregation ATPase FtsK/SpoIIIE